MRNRSFDADALAVLVADGRAIDWDAVLRSTSDDSEQRIVAQLRLVESIARVHESGAPSHRDPAAASAEPTLVALPASEPVPPALRTWGHLELREKLGAGGFGEVYRAWEPRLDREVALKLLKSESPIGRVASSNFVEEGRLLAKLRHPNVTAVYGAEVHAGRVGLWMELIRGRSLEQQLRAQGLFGPREAAAIGIELCRALAAVHGAGVVHRDVKAQNVMREEGGRIVLTDFGAGVETRGGLANEQGSVSGTPFYMSPERARGSGCDRLQRDRMGPTAREGQCLHYFPEPNDGVRGREFPDAGRRRLRQHRRDHCRP